MAHQRVEYINGALGLFRHRIDPCEILQIDYPDPGVAGQWQQRHRAFTRLYRLRCATGQGEGNAAAGVGVRAVRRFLDDGAPHAICALSA